MSLPSSQAYQLDSKTGEIMTIPSDTRALDQYLTKDLDALLTGPHWSEMQLTDEGVSYRAAESSHSKVRIMHACIRLPLTSMQTVRTFLGDSNNARVYSSECSKLAVLHTWADEPRRSIISTEISFSVPLVRSRFLSWYSTETINAQGCYIRAARSCRWPGAEVPRGAVRALLYCSGFIVVPTNSNNNNAAAAAAAAGNGGGGCTLHYISQADPCGMIPSAIVNQLQQDQLHVPLRIKKHLEGKQ